MENEFLNILNKELKTFNKHESKTLKISNEVESELNHWNNELEDLGAKKNKLIQELEESKNDKTEANERYKISCLKFEEQLKLKECNDREISGKMKIIAEYKERKKRALAKPNEKDIATLNKLKHKILAYQHLTGIFWNFQTLESKLCGYIRNKNKLKMIEFDHTKETEETIQLKLWKHITEMNSKN